MSGAQKHTAGPWDVTTVDHSSGGGGAVPSTLFRVGFPSHKDFTGHVADTCHGDSAANAHLIAAAPEMLEALHKIEQQLDYGQIDAARRLATDAIAKATGERP